MTALDKLRIKLTTNHRDENKKLWARSSLYKKLILSSVAAGFFAAVGTGICQYNSSENSSKDSSLSNEIWCNSLGVLVFLQDHQEAWIICEGARDAIVFLKLHGFDVTGTIVIEQLTKLPSGAGDSAAGYYLGSERRVLVLVYSEFTKFETWFGVSIDHSLYRSVISHEVAHVVADFNFTIAKPSIQAKEYIAYITQLSTMEPELRDRVLSHFDGKAFEGDWQMTSTIYMLDPMGFGIRAYLHFLKLIDGNEYLHSILNGETLLNIQYIY
jgi:hypothetical protein